MKKTLKLVFIFIGSLVSVIVCSLTGYFIISNNKTFHIYDVRLVEKVDEMQGYIYTDDEVEYTSIKNQTIYLNSSSTNIYPIAVYLSTTTSTTGLSITSSDTSIAKIVYKNGECFVQYLKEGVVTITSEFYGVKDSFVIQIFDQIPNEFVVYDYVYYGDYAELFANQIVSYADNNEYRFGFLLNNASHTGNNANIDSNLIEIDKLCLDENTFDIENTYIDAETDELVIRCKEPTTAQTDDIDDIIILQSFYYDENGKKMDGKTYRVDVHVVMYIPEFLQIEVSSSPNFEENVVYTHKIKENDFASKYTNEQIIKNPAVLKDFLSAEKEENFLAKNGETLTHNVFFTDKIDRVYLRLRMVYSNGDIVYLDDANANITMTSELHCKLSPTNDYYKLNLEKGSFDDFSNGEFVIEIDLKDFELEQAFSFNFSSDYKDFYTQDEQTGFYTFNYWDERAVFSNAIPDENGNIIGFGA